MKAKMFYIITLIIVLTGCSKNIKQDISQIDFTCKINENIVDCDNEISYYNELRNLTSIISKNGNSENYKYEYNDANEVIFIEKTGSEQIFIDYNENKKISTIKYVIDPSNPEELRTIINYTFFYNEDNMPIEIIKSYNNTTTIDNIKYKYYIKNNINYVEEEKIIGNKKYIRTFKRDNMIFSINILGNINYLPKIYFDNLKYIPSYSIASDNYIYDYKQSPLFIPALEYFEIINLDNGRSEKREYYYDSKTRFITDSTYNVIHNFEEKSKDEVVRYTIYKNELFENDIQYYKFETKYIYENNTLVKFIKYREEEISKEQYDKLQKSYLKLINKKN